MIIVVILSLLVQYSRVAFCTHFDLSWSSRYPRKVSHSLRVQTIFNVYHWISCYWSGKKLGNLAAGQVMRRLGYKWIALYRNSRVASYTALFAVCVHARTTVGGTHHHCSTTPHRWGHRMSSHCSCGREIALRVVKPWFELTTFKSDVVHAVITDINTEGTFTVVYIYTRSIKFILMVYFRYENLCVLCGRLGWVLQVSTTLCILLLAVCLCRGGK